MHGIYLISINYINFSSEPTESPLITSIKGEYQVNNTYPKTRLIVHWEVKRTALITF